jgi:hypothetical protein
MDLTGLDESGGPVLDLQAPTNPLSVDDALDLLAQGQVDLLAPQLDALMQKLQPLLDFFSQVRHNNAGQHSDKF